MGDANVAAIERRIRYVQERVKRENRIAALRRRLRSELGALASACRKAGDEAEAIRLEGTLEAMLLHIPPPYRPELVRQEQQLLIEWVPRRSWRDDGRTKGGRPESVDAILATWARQWLTDDEIAGLLAHDYQSSRSGAQRVRRLHAEPRRSENP